MKIIHPLLLLAWMPIAAPADTGRSGPANDAGWQVQQWTTEHGLPQNSVKAIAQTPDGYLWIGTLNGLARFDGVSFKVFTRFNTPGLVSDAINALTVDANGTLWVATGGGLMAWRDGVIQSWTTKEGLPGESVYQVIVRPKGGVWWREGFWIGQVSEDESGRRPKPDVGPARGSPETQRGRAEDEARKIREHRAFVAAAGLETRAPGVVQYTMAGHGLATNRVWSIVPTRDGGLIALTHLGAQRLDTKRESFGELIPWPGGGSDWRGWEDAAGRLWVSSEGGTFRCESNRWTALSGTNGFDIRTRFFEDGAGRFWIASEQRGLRWLQRDGTPAAPVPDLGRRSFSALFEDWEGNLWAGGGGLFRLRPRRIRAWTTAEGLPSDKVRSVCAGPDGDVWAGTEGGLARIQAGRVETFSGVETNAELGFLPVWADRIGAVWAFKPAQTLLRFDGRQFERTPVLPEAPGYVVNSLYEDRAGRLCVGIDRGVSVLREGRFERLFGSNVVGYSVFAMLEDRAGHWWLGTKGGGIRRFHDGGVTTFTTTNGLSDNKVTCLHEDADGAIWIGTENGLNRFKDGRLAVFRTSEGLPENVVNHILEDDFGNLWWSGLRGIHRASHTALNAVADGRTNRVSCFTYGEADGMASTETNGELQPAGCKTPDGHLWFPTIMGVVEIDPRLMVESELVPPVVLKQVKADGSIVFGDGAALSPRSAPIQLAPGSAQVLETHYTANSLTAPEKVRFQWKLEPRDRDWQDAGSQRFLFLQNLRPGDYTFRVKACNHHGLWNETGASFAFVIAPHFYETWLFYALCGAGLIALAGGVQAHRLHVQRRILGLERARVVDTERARIARDLHDELGSRLTALSVRAELAGRNGHDGGGKLRAFADESRALAERMRDVIWAVDPECDSLEALVARLTEHAEDFLGAAGLRLRLELPETLPALPLSADARHQLTMVAKEALHNAVKHARASEVRLGVELGDGEFRLRVSDNGAGFDQTRGRGRGLANMRERIRALDGALAVHSRPGEGTRVEATVPLRSLNQPIHKP